LIAELIYREIKEGEVIINREWEQMCKERNITPACSWISLLYNVYRVFPGGKERPGCDADPSPPCSAVVTTE